MTINDALLDQLLKDYQKPEDILGENGLLKQLTKAVLERALQAELTHHLGYDKPSPTGNHSGNSRNGQSKKTLKGDFGNLPLIIGINPSGRKEVLGLWIAQNAGATFWLQVLTDLQNRGVKDLFIAGGDGLKGFPEALEAAYPKTEAQLGIVHQVRNSLKDVSWKWCQEVAEDVKLIYTAATVEEAELNLEAFARKWDAQLPTISKSWRLNGERLTPFMSYPAEIRRVIYTTNVIESVNRSIRKVLNNRGSFPNEEAVIKLVYLTLRNISAKWNLPIRDWALAMNRFAIMFEGRMPLE